MTYPSTQYICRRIPANLSKKRVTRRDEEETKSREKTVDGHSLDGTAAIIHGVF